MTLVLPPPIRAATLDDLPEIWSFFQRAVGLPYSIDNGKAYQYLQRITLRDRGAIFVIDGEQGELAALLLAEFYQPWYSQQWVIGERSVHVLPDYRRKGYGALLLDFAKQLADYLKLPLEVGILSDERVDAKVRFYKRKLSYVGACFQYTPKGVGG